MSRTSTGSRTSLHPRESRTLGIASNTLSLVSPAGLVRPAIAALCAVVAGACAPSNTEQAQGAEPELVHVELLQLPYAEATTSPEISLRNLHAAIEGGESRFERLGDPASAASLVAALHLRASMLGTLTDLTLALEIAEQSVANAPESAASYELLAVSLAAVHRFDEAMSALDEAEEYGASVDSERHAIELARGDWRGALERRSAAVAQHSSYASYSDLAPALTAAGRFAEADAALVEALDAYRDVSPFAVAWVQFQRGVLWGEAAGRLDLAEPLYADALRLVPAYVAANVHLAEIEAETGRLDQAVARLRSVAHAEDPEPSARLSEFLLAVNRSESEVVATYAGEQWERWLSREELAFADHAAEFYLGAGSNPSRALELATVNLDNRQTDRSFELAIAAAVAADDLEQACELSGRAGTSRHRVGLRELQAELSCGL